MESALVMALRCAGGVGVRVDSSAQTAKAATVGGQSHTVAVGAIAIGAGMLFGLAGGMHPFRPLEFAGLVVAALVMFALARRQPVAENVGTMAQSFVTEFTTLLLLGAGPAMPVAAAAVVVKGRLADAERV